MLIHPYFEDPQLVSVGGLDQRAYTILMLVWTRLSRPRIDGTLALILT